MKKIVLSAIVVASLAMTVQAETTTTPVNTSKEVTQTTKVTPENYGLAETQVIFNGYLKKMAAVSGTNGTGVWLHNKKGADPKDKKVMRINFDTIYSFAIVDLTEPVTLVMPETNGRYQSAWIITEDHYNPFSFEKAGEYTLTQKSVGNRYAMIAIRTQANVEDPKDMEEANALQEKLVLKQKDRGEYKASHKWDMADIMKMREHYQELQRKTGITTEVMFGAKGLRTLEQHNIGTSFGWGGLTPKQAVYPAYNPTSSKPQTLTLKDVPVNAFWSITVYDKGGYPQTDTYNINSQFAKKNEDGSVTIHFGGDAKASNYMETFKDWNFILRLYQPTEAYFDGSWKLPKLVEVK